MHNSYETCTTSMERAQLLWNVRNSYETCATSMIYISSQTLQKALDNTIPIYIYIRCNIYIY